MLSPHALERALDESFAERSSHSGSESARSLNRTPSKSRQKLVALMLKNLEMTLESYMSDSQSSNDDKSLPYEGVGCFTDKKQSLSASLILTSPAVCGSCV